MLILSSFCSFKLKLFALFSETDICDSLIFNDFDSKESSLSWISDKFFLERLLDKPFPILSGFLLRFAFNNFPSFVKFTMLLRILSSG